MQHAAPPPGWYRDPAGWTRWWDGERWGPSLPDGRGASVENSRVAATAAHLGVLVAAVIVPLILYLAVDKRDRYARHHAREALNFQLSVALVILVPWLVAFVVMFSSIFVSAGSGSTDGSSGTNAAAGVGFGVVAAMWVIMMVGMLGQLAFSILGAVRAWQGVWWRYPVSIRFVKDRDAAPEHEVAYGSAPPPPPPG